MKPIVAPTSPTFELAGQVQRASAGVVSRSPTEPSAQAADLRLVIEEDEATGTIVYKTLDRRTGEVVRQLPREEVLRLKEDPDYEPGEVTDSRS